MKTRGFCLEAFCKVVVALCSAVGIFAQDERPVITGVRTDPTGVAVSALIPFGNHHALLEGKTEGAADWRAFVSGPVSGQQAVVTFHLPFSNGPTVLRVRAGQDQTIPAAMFSGADFFSADYSAESEVANLTSAQKIGHVLNRVGYGPSPASLAAAEAAGVMAYLAQQLHPENMSDNAVLAAKESALFMNYQPVQENVLIPVGSTWRYFKGQIEPPTDWKQSAFDDASWLQGPTGIGYGDGDDKTVLRDMQQVQATATSPGQPGYLTVYLRKKFFVRDPQQVDRLIFRVDYDDGFVAYLNGVEVARKNVTGTPPRFNQAASADHEAGNPEDIDVTARKSLLVAGDNVFAIQVHNASLTSSDLSMIPELLTRTPLPLPTVKRIKTITDLQQLVHVRGVYSDKQLQGVLGEFWQNHFTTDYDKDEKYLDDLENSDALDAMPPAQAALEAAQNSYSEYQFFYENALGNFGDLLLYSATSPSMLVYLDSVLNVKGTANENYAREIFELFAFGVDNRYTQKDIEQLAKCFTGWGLRKVWPNEKLPFPASARTPPTEPSVQFADTVLLNDGPGWKYFKGTAEPSPDANKAATTHWADLDFNDAAWLAGATSIGYGDNDDATVLTDMQGKYVSVYLRRPFTIQNPDQLDNLLLSVAYDDGFVAYVNGVEVARSKSMANTGTPPRYNTTATADHEVTLPTDFFSLREFTGLLRPAPEANILAIEVHNVTLNSSDLSIHPKLIVRQQLPGSLENGDPNGVWTFRFNPDEHDATAKVLFEGTPYELKIPAGRTGVDGVKDGIDVIDAIVRHPSASEFICLKLINKFVSDEITMESYRDGSAPAGLRKLMDDAIAAWRSTNPQGNIRAVLEAILDPQNQANFFWSARAYRAKIKTPVEFINSSGRALEADLAGNGLPAFNSKLGMDLFTRDDPDGWSELGKDWMDTSTLLQRIKFGQTLAGNVGTVIRWKPADFLKAHQLDSADSIVNFFNRMLYDGRLTDGQKKLLAQFAGTDEAGRPKPLDPKAADYISRVQDLVGLILSLPEWQYQ